MEVGAFVERDQGLVQGVFERAVSFGLTRRLLDRKHSPFVQLMFGLTNEQLEGLQHFVACALDRVALQQCIASIEALSNFDFSGLPFGWR